MATDEGMIEMSAGIEGKPQMRQCNKCDWSGTEAECVHPKHVPDQLLCPNCNETTFAVGCQAGSDVR